VAGWDRIQMENHCLNFSQMFVGPNQSPIKRSDFVAGLDLIPNCETGVKLFVSKAYLNVQTGVEN